jgi:hypothetical protein
MITIAQGRACLQQLREMEARTRTPWGFDGKATKALRALGWCGLPPEGGTFAAERGSVAEDEIQLALAWCATISSEARAFKIPFTGEIAMDRDFAASLKLEIFRAILNAESAITSPPKAAETANEVFKTLYGDPPAQGGER